MVLTMEGTQVVVAEVHQVHQSRIKLLQDALQAIQMRREAREQNRLIATSSMYQGPWA